MKTKKYPPIRPQFYGNKDDKNAKVLLDYDVYLSILEEIDELEKEFNDKKTKTNKPSIKKPKKKTPFH